MNSERISFYIDKKIVYVDVLRTSNKNMYLKVNGDAIVVSAHKRIKLSVIKSFVDEHIEKFVKYVEQKKENELFSLTKKTIWIGGKTYKLAILTGFKKSSSSIEGNTLYLKLLAGTDIEATTEIKKFLKKYVFDKVSKMQIKMEKEMSIATHTFSVRYKTSTWGSNSLRSRNISYSSRLGHYNDDVIEYVVIHELAHFIEPNHSKDFWDLVSEYQPEYKELRKQLHENKSPIN